MLNFQKRQLREDMMVVLRYLKGYHIVEDSDLFLLAPEDNTRTNGLKLQGCREK